MGSAARPKFPPSMVLEFLLRHHARTGSADALAMARGTCAAMARGGMYDQLGGGFARYSVDADWVVPHFEKMLYDNAQLLRVYAHLWRTTGDPLARRVTEETADFLLRDLRTDEGAFASALDADTVVDGHSHEGLTYSWTPGAARRGARRRSTASVRRRCWGSRHAGTFEAGASTLQLRTDPDDPAWWASDARAAARGARDAAATQPRRQGGHGVERAGGRGPRGCRGAARAARPGRRGGDRGGLRARRAPRRRDAAAHLPRWAGRHRAGGARRPRRPRGGPARAAPGDG